MGASTQTDASTAGPASVFVYGTLQPGEPRWPLVVTFVGGPTRRASVAGRLYDTGRGYPAARFDHAGDEPVPGHVVPIDPANLNRALAVLDEVEGTGFGLFERQLVTTTDGEPTWAYAWQSDCADLTPIRAWVA